MQEVILCRQYEFLTLDSTEAKWWNSWRRRGCKRGKMGAGGATGDLPDSILCLNRNSKFITYLEVLAITVIVPSAPSLLREKRRVACMTPPVFQSRAWGGNKHIYGDIFHTLSRDVKGLGSAGEPADWISALVAIPRFCNLKASWRKNTHKKENWARHRWLRCYQGVLWYVTWLSVIKQSWSTLLYLSVICQGYYSLHEL